MFVALGKEFDMDGSEAGGGEGETKEIYHSSLNLDVISFLLFPQASEPSFNFNIFKLVYWTLMRLLIFSSLRESFSSRGKLGQRQQ